MNRVYLGVGSNVDRTANICAGLDALQAGYGELLLSPVYESAALGFDGDPFLNLVVGLDTSLGVAELFSRLRALEFEMGRPEKASRYSPRTLDIDILCYGRCNGLVEGLQLPRTEITENAFVLRPLSELAPNDVHPPTGKSFSLLWEGYPADAQPLSRVDFWWGDRQVSSCG